MRKLFLLIPALVLSLVLNAKEINITPTSPHTSGNNLLATLADAGTEDGDVIILADGVYNESSNYIYFNKSVEVRAAEGAHPVVEVECEVRIGKNVSGKNINIRGIKFDASKQDDTGNNTTSYSHFIRIYSAGTLDFENCEFYSSANKVIEVESSSSVDNLVINNCYFHDNNNSCIYIDNTVASNLTITNSTFTNSPTTSKGTIFSKAAASSIIRIDHCTFYDCTTENTDFGVIGHNGFLPTDVIVSNCIFAWGTEYNKRATYLPSGTFVTNCLTYNTNKDTDKWGHHSGPTFSNCILQDPLFNDLANNKYTFANNWVTMSISPACGAATDGSDLGDPRWYSAETLPSTDFASPYAFIGANAIVSDKMELDENNYIHSKGSSGGSAIWKVTATRACAVQVTLNMSDATTSGHNYQVEIFDANGNSKGALNEGGWYDTTDDKILSGCIYLPVGDYKIVLTNSISGSSATIKGITLSYVGGSEQAMPGTTDINEAWFSANGTRADGKISYTSIGSGCWAKWNINVASAGTYSVTVNIQNQYGHNYSVEFLKEGESTPISIGEGETTYGHDATLFPVEVGTVALEAGNYEMKVSNAIGDAALLGVELAYAGGAAIDLSKAAPANLLPNADVILSDNWIIEEGKISYSESAATTGWAKWNVACADAGNYNVTINIASDNGHLMKVEVLEDENLPAIFTLNETEETHWSTGDLAISLGGIDLGIKEYIFKVTNTQSSSHAKIASVVISYVGGAVIDIPGAIDLNEAILHGATRDNDGIHFGAVDRYAEWNVAAAAGLYTFTIDVVGTNYGHYQLTILDGENIIYDEYKGQSASGSVTHSSIYLDGNYTLRVANTNSGANGYITSISATAEENVFVMDENTTDDGSIAAADGNTYKFLLKRSFTAGKYYTICLPVGSWNDELKLAFGADYELWAMSSATQSGDEINLNFTQINGESFHAGMPYLIKPSINVENPIFYNEKTIHNYTYNNVQSFDAADFVGSFYKTVIPAGESNLYLQNNELFYNANNDTPIKGTRAWIRLKQQAGNQAPARARIVLQNQVATSIDLVKDANNGTIKTIENGQLVIIRDGVRYDVMGTKIQ